MLAAIIVKQTCIVLKGKYSPATVSFPASIIHNQLKIYFQLKDIKHSPIKGYNKRQDHLNFIGKGGGLC